MSELHTTSLLTRDQLVSSLHSIGCICFGSFTLKSGIESPIYIDLRLIVSHPNVLASVAHLMYMAVTQDEEHPSTPFSLVCGVPYTALPIATAMSLRHCVPMVMRRKEVKSHGLKKSIEGSFAHGDNVLVVEDLVTSALSISETVDPIRSVGLVCDKAVVLIDRQQGGRRNLEKMGIRLFSVLTITEIVDILRKESKISEDTSLRVMKFIEENQIDLNEFEKKNTEHKNTVSHKETFDRRSQSATNAVTKKLFTLCHEKQTNLCVSADFTKADDILELADSVGAHICCLKLHVDIIEDFSKEFIDKLKALSVKHRFIIFEDRKFADIGSTLQMQYSKGIYNIKQWADIVNLHLIAGEETVEALKTESLKGCESGPSSSVLIVAEMSSKGNLITPQYTAECVRVAESHSEFVMGFICQHQISKDPRMVHMTPGVQMDWEKEGDVSHGDGMGQQYSHPKTVIENGSDIIIVGRGIIGQPKPKRVFAAAKYQEVAWKAYQQRIKRD